MVDKPPCCPKSMSVSNRSPTMQMRLLSTPACKGMASVRPNHGCDLLTWRIEDLPPLV